MNKEAVDSEMEEKESKDNESDEEGTDKSEKPNSSRYEKKFNTRWLNDYTWLKHNSEKEMFKMWTVYPLWETVLFHYWMHKLQNFVAYIEALEDYVSESLITLAEMALILPIHTADCERGFSKQNLIKSKSQNRIEDAALNRLMMISIEGRPLDEFDFAQSLSIWKAEKDRRIFCKP